MFTFNDLKQLFKRTKKVSKNNTNKAKEKQINKKEDKKDFTFTKKIVLFVLIMAELEICATYVLAFLGRTSIVEQLSIQTTITVVGVVLTYSLKALTENLSKNRIFDQSVVIADNMRKEIVDSVQDDECEQNEQQEQNESQNKG